MVIITLPAYNEEPSLGTLLESVRKFMDAERLAYRVIVVNDGSTDGTAAVVDSLSASMPVERIDHDENRGLGEAVRTGLLRAVALAEGDDIVVTMDSDNTHTPDLVPDLVRGVREGRDVVIASRFRPGARAFGVPLYRRVLSRGASWAFRAIFPTRGVRDFTSGYRAYRASLLARAFDAYGEQLFAESGFACMVDILLKLRDLGARMGEVPLVLRYDFKYSVSKMDVMRTLGQTLRLIAARRLALRPRSALDARSVRAYFARRGTVASWWAPEAGPLAYHYAAELQVIGDRLQIDPSWEVLDVGTGRGRFGLYFAARGCRVLGVDVNPDMLELAREAARRAGVSQRFDVRAGDAEALRDFADARFDVVLCMELFDHLPDLRRALQEARRVLRPGGRLVFSFVPSGSLYGVLGNALRWVLRRRRSELPLLSRTYAFEEMRRSLAVAGLRLERYWGIGLLCLNAQTRVLPGLRRLGVLDALGRAEARRRPYHSAPWLARRGAHVVGFAVRADGGGA